MDREKRITSQNSDTPRRNRVKRIKTFIIVIAIVLLILPSIISVILFFRMNFLQKQIDILMIDRYGVTYTGQNSTSEESVAHAATNYKSSISSEAGRGSRSKSGKTEENTQAVNNPTGINTAASTKDSETKANKTEELPVSEFSKADTEISKDTSKKDMNQKATTNKDKTQEEFKAFDKKQVYLTFDDGPSKYTEEILKILSDYDAKATFFVIGKTDEHSKKMYQEIVEQGHTLGMHSYSHDYNKIYKSVEDFDKDFTKIRKLLYDTTGYYPSIYRFPGGSNSSLMKEDVSMLINYLNQKSVVYFDWNVVSGDATGVDYTPEELYENVINGIKLHNRSIVLMHDTDTKANTVTSLKMILKTLTEHGAEILPLNENVTPIQQVKANSKKQKN